MSAILEIAPCLQYEDIQSVLTEENRASSLPMDPQSSRASQHLRDVSGTRGGVLRTQKEWEPGLPCRGPLGIGGQSGLQGEGISNLWAGRTEDSIL